MGFSTHPCSAVFAYHVPCIVGLRAYKEVIRSDATAIVTMVTDTYAREERSIMEFKRKAMGHDRFPRDPEFAIPIPRQTSCPQPAPAGFFDFVPGTFCKGREAMPHMMTTAPTSTSFTYLLATAQAQSIVLSSHDACTSNARRVVSPLGCFHHSRGRYSISNYTTYGGWRTSLFL